MTTTPTDDNVMIISRTRARTGCARVRGPSNRYAKSIRNGQCHFIRISSARGIAIAGTARWGLTAALYIVDVVVVVVVIRNACALGRFSCQTVVVVVVRRTLRSVPVSRAPRV